MKNTKHKPLKKINSFKATDRTWEIIGELIGLHKIIEQDVDFSAQNKKLALYLILGGMTSSLIRSVHALEYGETERHAMLQRILAESMDLAIFFCEISEDARQIKQWFNGRIIERQPGNSGNLSLAERAQLLETEETTIKNMDETKKIANELLSKYMHPSYDLMTITFDGETNAFRYYAQRQEKFSSDEMRGRIRFGVQSVLTAFGMTFFTVFPLNTADHLKKVAGLMREIYPEAYSD